MQRRCHHLFHMLNKFCHKFVFSTTGWTAMTHMIVNGWWKRSSIFLKLNAHQPRPWVICKPTFFVFKIGARPTRYGSRWSLWTRWKDSTFIIMDCVLQRRWAKLWWARVMKDFIVSSSVLSSRWWCICLSGYLLSVVKILQSPTQLKLQSPTHKSLMGCRAQTRPCNESLHISGPKRKVLHYRLSWHRRWWNCDQRKSVGNSDVDVRLSD